MMDSAPAKLKFTYRDYLLLPEEKRYELIDGDLYMVPAPRPYHQIVSGEIELALRLFVDQKGMGRIIHSPCDVYFSQYDVVQPDILFISTEKLGIIKENFVEGAPDLLIEILSPSSREKDRELKRKLYARNGVQEYWIVDPEGKTIEVLTLLQDDLQRHSIFRGEEKLKSPLLAGFLLHLPRAFPKVP